MPVPILPVSAATLPEAIRPAGSPAAGGAFQDVFTSAIQKVEAVNRNAETSVERFLSGEGEDLHTTVLATTQAELSFNMFLQTRNKVVSAYQEIMRMQI
jgi:flagellar hook-basal body complex protein FliE